MGSHTVSTTVERRALAVVLVVLVAGLVFFTIRFAGRMPEAISPIGQEIDSLFRFLLTVTGVIVIAAHLYLAAVLWRFGDERAQAPIVRRQWPWVLVPIGLLFLADITFDHKSNKIWGKVFGTPPADAFTVEVTGEQFAWAIRYPGKDGKFGKTDLRNITDDNPLGLDRNDPAGKDDIFFPAGQGELHIPVNRPVLFLIKSKDVLHSFCIPWVRLKMDAVPGMTTKLWFTPSKEGQYEFTCAELCGLGHYKMRGILIVESSDKLEEWLSQQPTAADLIP
ncbi:MAG: cytochrome-c oxidase [Armatimonadetes bacterium]|nr:cytochrome-c oxidase [Armatimonadota bacterium]MDW8121678.1 cytochrome-c oxidase [Armatimonadota bacterium]